MRPYVIMLVVSLIASASAFVIAQQREDTARLTEELATRRIRTAADNAILDGVFGAMNDGVLVTDPDGRVVLTNRAAQHLLGTKVSPGERESTLLAGLLRPDGSGPLTREHVRGFLAETDGGVLNVAVPADSSSGLRSLGLTSRPLLQSNRAHRLIMFRDTTAQQERQHQLKVFARSVARDLNKPLESLGNAIGTTQDLLWNEESHAAGVALERTVQSAMRIRSLIDDHIAATLAREGVIRPTEIELSALLRGTVWSSGLEDFLLEIQTPHAVFADESLVRQLVMNLIQGAVERAEEGQLASVRVISAPADGQGWVSVSFADRGAPLTSGPQTAPGAQADPAGRFADSPRLALCHTIVSRHGGQLSVESTDSGASTITFTLPAA